MESEKVCEDAGRQKNRIERGEEGKKTDIVAVKRARKRMRIRKVDGEIN
jgi:hypothetical protein